MATLISIVLAILGTSCIGLAGIVIKLIWLDRPAQKQNARIAQVNADAAAEQARANVDAQRITELAAVWGQLVTLRKSADEAAQLFQEKMEKAEANSRTKDTNISRLESRVAKLLLRVDALEQEMSKNGLKIPPL